METPHRDILRVLILNHLDDIAHNRLPAIQRRTGFDLNAIKEAIDVLRHLNLRRNQIDETGTRALAASPHLANLRHLRLGENHIGPEGARWLAASPRLAGLQHCQSRQPL